MNSNPTEFRRGWNAAGEHLNEGLAHLGDPGFDPPLNDYQKGYNARIEATGATDLVGIIICAAIGAAILFGLMLVLYRP